MKSPFDTDIDNSLSEIMSVFGVTCWIQGTEYTAIFNDEEFEDESGYRHDLSIEIESSNFPFIFEGDTVVAMDREFYVRHVQRPSTEDPLIKIGLKRA